METLIAEMNYQRLKEKMEEMVFTVLTRGEGSDGIWHSLEINRIVNSLVTEAHRLPKLPQHVILQGEYTKEQVLKAMLGGQTFTVEVVTGIDNEKLPFRPNIQFGI